jgi:hypothetical protein
VPTPRARIKEDWLIGLATAKIQFIDIIHHNLTGFPTNPDQELLLKRSEFSICWISGVGSHRWILAKNGEMQFTYNPLYIQNNEFQELDTRGEWSFSGDILTLKMSTKCVSHGGAIRGEENSLVELKIEQCEHKITEDELQKYKTQLLASGGRLGSFKDSADAINNLQKNHFDVYCVSYQSQVRGEYRDVNGKITVSEGYSLEGEKRNLKYNGPPFFIGTVMLQATSGSESVIPAVPAPVTTPSPTTTPAPVATNTPSGREAIKEALRRDPEFAEMTDEQLDSFLDKIDHASLSRWTLADYIKAEKEYLESGGIDSYPGPVIRNPDPTPPAVIKNPSNGPYDWIRHSQREVEVQRKIDKLNSEIQNALDGDRELREARDNLRRQLEVLRNVRNQAMRNPSLYVPRPPVRR